MVADRLVFGKEGPQEFVDKCPARFVEVQKNKAIRYDHQHLPRRDRRTLGLERQSGYGGRISLH